MRGADLVHVEDFAVRRRLAVELRTVPGSDAGLPIFVIGLRVIPYASDLVGLADLVAALLDLSGTTDRLRALEEKLRLGAAGKRDGHACEQHLPQPQQPLHPAFCSFLPALRRILYTIDPLFGRQDARRPMRSNGTGSTSELFRNSHKIGRAH